MPGRPHTTSGPPSAEHAGSEQTLIVVDAEDRVLGYAPRQECHLGAGRQHRAVAVALVDPSGRLLLQRRKAALWDGYWDIAGATHPLYTAAGEEGYEAAAARCLRAEWDVDAEPARVGVFRYFAPFDGRCENELCVLLVAHHDGPVAPNPDHAYAMRWLRPAELANEIARDPEAFTPWARLAAPLLGAG